MPRIFFPVGQCDGISIIDCHWSDQMACDVELRSNGPESEKRESSGASPLVAQSKGSVFTLNTFGTRMSDLRLYWLGTYDKQNHTKYSAEKQAQTDKTAAGSPLKRQLSMYHTHTLRCCLTTTGAVSKKERNSSRHRIV
jgi:hypothetical protein